MIQTEDIQIEITAEQVSEWHPLFAFPCYDQMVTEPFFMSFIKSTVMFKDIGMQFSVSTVSDSLINRARNQLVAKFMGNKSFTHLMFIDVDLQFNPDDILKLLWHDKDIVTGAYPIKDINWEKVSDAAKSGVEPKDLQENGIRFVVNAARSGENTVRVDNGALEVYDAGTGFMLIKRSVFERMFEAYPELKYDDDTGLLKGDERNYSYALFNSYVDDEGRFLSEDYGFGRYWQKIGGSVWTDPTVELSHLGRMKYSGKLINYITKMAE